MTDKLQEYAQLLINVGLNVQKDQYVVISSQVDCAYFARMCIAAAYEAGAKQVIMNWNDDFATRQYYLNAADEVFDQVFPWEAERPIGLLKKGACVLTIAARDPENLKGVDPERIARANIASGKANEEFSIEMMNSAVQWCIASIPVPSWAKKVFPDLSEEQAMEKLWEEIFKAVRITGCGDAVDRWREHCKVLEKKREKLNAYNFKSLHYTNSLGTDLTVELPENHIWMAGSEFSKGGVEFVANMPTEEIFTAPLRDGVNGKIVATKPLVDSGNIIDGFHMILKDGVITEVHAEVGEEFLKKAITLDEGASRFGEVALVPYDSPISNSGVLFYNTLFDENASCHFAFGDSYACIKDGDKMTKEELKAHGLNDSMTHVDFMVGSKDLSIVGTTHDGKEIKVFENGNFVI